MSKKSILITGCSTGIGFDAAKTLVERGYRVFATARQQQDLNQLKELGCEALYLELKDEQSIDACVDSVLEKTGGELYALFNNAAYGQPGAIEDLPIEALKQQFEVNLFSWHRLTQKIIPVMRKQGYGRIIQNSSVLGFVTMPYRGAYNASKFALEGYTDTLRLELSNTPIQVVLIEPGPIESQFRMNALKAFERFINWENSEHSVNYQKQMSRLAKTVNNTPFTLPASAVTKVLIKALESKRPKLRYRVTFPTHLFAILKRLLPTRWLDRLLAKS